MIEYAHLGVNSLHFISLDGLCRACGEEGGRKVLDPKFCDACFSGEYPVRPTDMMSKGFVTKGG